MFGQLVCGPPGVGKSTYVRRVASLLQRLQRPLVLINLDPGCVDRYEKTDKNDAEEDDATEDAFITFHVDVRSLITIDDAMQTFGLGPNGGQMYCMEVLAQNTNWLKKQLEPFSEHYALIDMPGQSELYTHHTAMRTVIAAIGGTFTAVHLIDALNMLDTHRLIAAVMLSMTAMMAMEMPHINVFTKVDLLKGNRLRFPLEFYTDTLELDELLDKEEQHGRYAKLTRAIVDVINDYSMVSFETVDLASAKSVIHLTKQIDKANGYVWLSEVERERNERPEYSLFDMVGRDDDAEDYAARIGDIEERYLASEDDAEESQRPAL